MSEGQAEVHTRVKCPSLYRVVPRRFRHSFKPYPNEIKMTGANGDGKDIGLAPKRAVRLGCKQQRHRIQRARDTLDPPWRKHPMT